MAGLTFVDLVMDDGELVRIECPSKHEDELHETLDQCRKRRDWWASSRFDGCSATYMGHMIDKVNMARVVGMM